MLDHSRCLVNSWWIDSVFCPRPTCSCPDSWSIPGRQCYQERSLEVRGSRLLSVYIIGHPIHRPFDHSLCPHGVNAATIIIWLWNLHSTPQNNCVFVGLTQKYSVSSFHLPFSFLKCHCWEKPYRSYQSLSLKIYSFQKPQTRLQALRTQKETQTARPPGRVHSESHVPHTSPPRISSHPNCSSLSSSNIGSFETNLWHSPTQCQELVTWYPAKQNIGFGRKALLCWFNLCMSVGFISLQWQDVILIFIRTGRVM